MLHMIVSSALPSHGRPPCWAGGLLHVLTRVWLPGPQLRVHSSHGLHADQPPATAQRTDGRIKGLPHRGSQAEPDGAHPEESHVIPGHSLGWQCRVSESGPGHGLPPLAGGGLLHKRLLLCTPLPQLTLQDFQVDHWEKPP